MIMWQSIHTRTHKYWHCNVFQCSMTNVESTRTHTHTHTRTHKTRTYSLALQRVLMLYDERRKHTHTHTRTRTHTWTHTPCTVAPQRPARGTAEHMPYLWARAAASPKAHPNCPAAYARGLRRLLALFVDLQTLCSWEDVERRTGGSAGPSASPGMCKREG